MLLVNHKDCVTAWLFASYSAWVSFVTLLHTSIWWLVRYDFALRHF